MVKRPCLSVIIPAYNSGPALLRLLKSLGRSSYHDFEVIVGDDASGIPLKSLWFPHQLLPDVTFVRLKTNQGPAAARNLASRKARGKILVFLDSDVEVYPNTLKLIAAKFKRDIDLTALTGVWDKHQRTKRFFPQFKALRDWSYWINESDSGGYYYLFSTRIAAIKKDVFLRMGGFNVSFRQMEDVELTYRIAERYAIIFAPDVRVHHEFEGFLAVAKKYFWRSYFWSKIYVKRHKFDSVATTSWEMVTGVCGVGSLIVLSLGLISYLFYPNLLIFAYTFLISLILLLLHSLLLRKFLYFIYREKGLNFTVKALFTGLLLYLVIVAGTLYFLTKRFLAKKKR